MSMSQLPDANEQWDEMWSHFRWYHLPLLLGILVLIPVYTAMVALASIGTRKVKND